MSIYETSEVEYLRQRVEELQQISQQLQAILHSLGYAIERTHNGLKAVPIRGQA